MKLKRYFRILAFFFTVFGLSILLSYFVIKSKEEFRLKAKAYLNSDIQKIIQDKEIGDIYNIKTLRFPGDSLDIYFWRGFTLILGDILCIRVLTPLIALFEKYVFRNFKKNRYPPILVRRYIPNCLVDG